MKIFKNRSNIHLGALRPWHWGKFSGCQNCCGVFPSSSGGSKDRTSVWGVALRSFHKGGSPRRQTGRRAPTVPYGGRVLVFPRGHTAGAFNPHRGLPHPQVLGPTLLPNQPPVSRMLGGKGVPWFMKSGAASRLGVSLWNFLWVPLLS